MDFSTLELNVRSFIEQGKEREALELLGNTLPAGNDRDEVSLLLASYNSIIQKSTTKTINELDAEIAMNSLRANILKFLSAKKDYYKYREQTFGQSSSQQPDGAHAVKVFFSVGSPHNELQQQYIDNLKAYFSQHGILLETLKGWNDEDPLVAILAEMKDAHGCLVLAFERFYMKEGVLKRGSEQEHQVKDQSFTSSWLQIEAALARSLEMPLIILKDNALQSDGLIHNDKQEWGIVLIDHRNAAEIDAYPVKNFLLNWINQVKKHARNK